jgi:hypothetical protein
MTEAELERLFAEYSSLANAIEEDHPGCLHRSDRWSSGGAYVHGIIGGRPCPASSHHVRRSQLLKRCIELYMRAPEPSVRPA